MAYEKFLQEIPKLCVAFVVTLRYASSMGRLTRHSGERPGDKAMFTYTVTASYPNGQITVYSYQADCADEAQEIYIDDVESRGFATGTIQSIKRAA